MEGLEHILQGIGFLFENGDAIDRRAGTLGFLSILSFTGSVPWCIVELIRLADAGYSGGFMALLGLGALAVAFVIPLLLFWLRWVHSYRPAGFFLVVAALAVLLTAGSSYALRHQDVVLPATATSR